MMTKDQIIERIREMKETPGQWAWSEEAFVMQVTTLLEVLEVSEDNLVEWLVEINCKFKVDIEDDRAQEIVDSALRLVEPETATVMAMDFDYGQID